MEAKDHARTRSARWRGAVAWIGAAATLGAVGLTAPPAAAAPALPPASGASQPVIVVLKDQLASRPADRAHVGARRGVAQSSQSAVLGRLRGSKPTKVIHYTVGNAFAATVTAAQAAQLASDPAVSSVVPDRTVAVPPPAAAPAAGAASQQARRAQAVAAPSAVDPGACSSDPAKPKLEPEALQSMNVRSEDPTAKTAAALGIDGSGVKVAYIADGINPANAGFRRTNGKSSVVDYQDFYGDGPSAPTSGAEAFGDASAVSAQGNVVYDVADYSNPAVVSYPGGHCYIKIVGVAPGADVVGLKAGSELLPNSAILQSIDYAVSVAKVDVINESFGGNLVPDSGTRNTIQLFNDNAVRAGVTVVASTGDAGITSTIGSPATDPLVISTGASTDSRIYEQTGYALATAFGNGRWQDGNISSLSSAGITQAGRTIDVSAPGEADWAVCDDGGNFTGCTSFANPDHRYAKIQSFGGTSQSAPFTAGTAALVVQAYRKTHGGASPAPALVKKIITSTARDLGLPGDEQGTGQVDARAAVEAALTWPGATSAVAATSASTTATTTTAAAAAAVTDVASNVALSTDQLTLTGRTGRTVTGRFTVRNVGKQAQTVVASARRRALLSSTSQTLAVSASSGQTTPYPTTAAPWTYQKFTFAVPAGADELASTIRWASGAAYGGAGPVVRLSLFAPDGTYAGNTRPQGGTAPANYGLITLKRPAAGTWTGILYTPVTGGFTGNVTAANQTFRSVPVGKVSPSSKRLQPGASTPVTLKLPVPGVGGDTVYTASVGSSGGHQTAVPVVVRALVPTTGSGAFAGTITGGNARSYSPAQTFSYAFDVPKHKRDLDVAVTLGSNPRYLLQGVLVDPRGEVQSINSNQTGTAQGRSLQNTVAAPTAGRWRYVVVVESPVPGTQPTEGFRGTVAFNRVKVSVGKLPKTITKGTAVRATVKVTNRGPAPMLLQTDARLDRVSTAQLAPQFAGSTLKLPQDVEDLSQLPAYLVPPDTSRLTLSASTTSPAQVELNAPAGGIDVFGDLTRAQQGDTVSTATVSEKRSSVGLGYWAAYVQQIGPFSDAGAPEATSVLTATAVTKGFDAAVTSSTGDPFLAAVDPTADPGTPLVVAPGATKTITVTITPTGARGSRVSGVLHLVTTPIGVANLFNTTGEVVANLPYAYRVG